MSRPAERRLTAITLALVAVAAILPFLPSLSGEFVFDDRYQILDNDQLRDLRNLPRFFTADVWAAVGLPWSPYYRPLMYTTFALEFAVGGPNPFVFRATNLALHVVASGLVLLLLRRTGASLAAAGLAGLLFAVHPMHAEVVAWPSARPELLVTVFALAAAFVHAGGDAREGPGLRRFLAVGLLVLLALFSKETGVLAPVLIGLVTMLRAPEPRAWGRIRAGVSAALPFVALFVVFMGVRGLVIRAGSLPRLVGDDPAGRLPRTAGDALLRVAAIAGDYLGAMLVPWSPSSFRVPKLEAVRAGLAWLPLGIAALVAAPFRAAAAWLAFAFLSVTLQAVGVADAGYLSQRYAYLPSVGVCAALGLALSTLGFERGPTWRRGVAAALAAFIVAAWAGLLVPRSLEWTTERGLWEAAYARTPDSPAVLANHAYQLVEAGRAEEAAALFEQLEIVDPGGWAAPYGMGNVRVAQGRAREAIPFYEDAIRRSPKIPHLRRTLGFLYEDLGEPENAKRVLTEALEIFPESALGLGALSVLEANTGDPAKALAATEEALAQRPDVGELRVNRIVLLVRLGRVDEAIAASEALTRDPALAREGHRSLGILYDTHRPDPLRALRHYEEALRLAPERADAAELRARIAVLRRKTGDGLRAPAAPPPG